MFSITCNTGLTDTKDEQMYEILGWLPIDQIACETHGASHFILHLAHDIANFRRSLRKRLAANCTYYWQLIALYRQLTGIWDLVRGEAFVGCWRKSEK